MSSKILVRKYMTLAEFVAYLMNGRLPTDALFERQFDSVHPVNKKERAAAELRARCILELGLVHVTGYRYTRLPLLSLPFISVIMLIGFVGCSLFKRKIDMRIADHPLNAGITTYSLLGAPFAFKMLSDQAIPSVETQVLSGKTALYRLYSLRRSRLLPLC